MKNVKALVFAGIALAAIGSTTSAHAGGLFGCSGSGALIRGSVGCTVKKKVNPIVTPMVRQAVVNGGRALGTKFGGPVGGMIGGQFGQAINNAARGGNGGFRPAPQPQFQQPVQQPRFVQRQAPMGNFCMTPYGRFGPGPVNPLGSPCNAFVNGMQVWGNVSR